jgi:virginiamycin B lyase
MNTYKLLVSALMLISILLSACAPAATATVIPPTADPTTAPAISISPTSPSETPAIGRLLETIPLPVKTNRDAVYAFDSFWLIEDNIGTITRWNPSSRQTLATITVGDPAKAPYGDPVAVVATTDSVWATSVATSEIVRIDPGTNQIVERIPLGKVDDRDFVINVMVGDDHNMWVWDYGRMIALRVDLQTKQVVAKFTNTLPAAVADGSLWAWNAQYPKDASKLLRIDPATDQVIATIPLDNVSIATASTNNTLWFGHGNDLLGIDPGTNQLTAIVHLGGRAFGWIWVNGKVWASAIPANGPPACHDLKQSFLVQIEPSTNSVVEKIGLDCAGQVFQFGDVLWVFTGTATSNYGAENFVVVDPAQ